MAELESRLQTALAGSYTVERLLGQGGMAQVFLARDLRHGRPVAIKVFLPQVAAAFGTGRFVREIRTAANLSHPNILALYDSGEADGLYYYVMPYVEGESLASRITREGPLPIEEALTITRQVAAALQHAHSRGIVHRDIKPGNILLSAGNAYVADFGIAQALEETGGERLTSTGFALGTPAYMSPEQSGGYGQLDGRADIYSLGCVLFEMLVGEPPFSGRSAQAVLARHSVERVPSARAVRDTVPWAVEQAIHRAMAKMPADRFASAEEFAAALAPERISQQVPLQPAPTFRLERRWVFAVGAFAGVGLIVLVALAPWSGKPAPIRVAPDPDLVTVLPFRATEPGDTALVRLAAEIPGLLEQHLTGDGGPRAVADSAAAGLRLTGTVTQVGDRLFLSARLLRAASGQVVAQFEKMSGPADSLTSVVNRALTRLLAGTAGESPELTEALAAMPLPVVKAQLAARRAFFRGEMDSAAARFEEVLRADSTFVPAALGLLAAASNRPSAIDQGVRLAQSQFSRLNEADQLYLAALRGSGVTIGDRIAAWGRAVTAAPERAERWFLLAEVLFHEGPWTGIPDILQRAHGAFSEAVKLEPRFVPALGHLIDLAASAGDSADVRALGGRYLALDSAGDLADYYRWRVAVALGDQRQLQAIRVRLDSLSEATLSRIVNVTQLDGLALEDGLRAAEALWSRSGLWSDMRWGYTKRLEIALNRGRPAEAAALTQRWIADHPFRPLDRLSEVVNALFWDADTTLAAREISGLAQLGGPPRAFSSNQGLDAAHDLCALSLWQASRGQLDRLPQAIAELRRVAAGEQNPPIYRLLCASILEIQLAAAERRPELRTRVEALDSLVRGNSTLSWFRAAANLTAARYWEELKEPLRALTATRRRLYITDIGEPRVLVAHSTLLREEGRLAALTGDRDGAMRAYRRYLALRADAEPVLAPQVARVRAALDSLTGSRSQEAGVRNQESGIRGKP
ncbi:MAG TPA: serine/threonine-protein kinase [Gemmatimonadales bacterium]|jgi:serine/threonine-protein kinase|nr:serine/threonine-protein kinase [Gemmatimonadales bacterium]